MLRFIVELFAAEINQIQNNTDIDEQNQNSRQCRLLKNFVNFDGNIKPAGNKQVNKSYVIQWQYECAK